MPPSFKIYGVNLPVYRSKWFRLKDREKAILALTSHHAVYRLTTRRYALLVSPEQSEEFLAAVQNPPAAGRVFSIAGTRRR